MYWIGLKLTIESKGEKALSYFWDKAFFIVRQH